MLCFSVCVRLHRKAVFAISVDNEAINLTVCGLSTRCFILFQTLRKEGKKLKIQLTELGCFGHYKDFDLADELNGF